MAIVLLLFVLYMLFMLMIIHKGDLMEPSVILCAMYFVCILFSLYNWEVWEMASYSFQAAAYIAIAIAVFACVGIIVEKVFYRGRRYVIGEATNPRNCIKEIKINYWLLIPLLLLGAGTLAWFFVEMRRIATTGNPSGTSWTMLLSAYRSAASYSVLNVEDRMPFLLNQLVKVNMVEGYFFAFVLANNVIARKFKSRDLPLFLPIIVMVAQTLINAGRLELLKLAAFVLVAWYILWHRQHGWNRNVSIKYVRTSIGVLVLMLIAFYMLKEVVGRTTVMDPFYYISLYTGGSIKLFDMYLADPIAPSSIWGKETFHTLNQFLSKFGYEELAYIRHLEFRRYNGLNVGNVYGSLRRYYHDFGFGGMCALVAIFSLFYNALYSKAKHSFDRTASFRTLFYAYSVHAIFLFPIDDLFFSSILSVSFISNTIILFGLYGLLCHKWKFRVSVMKRHKAYV